MRENKGFERDNRKKMHFGPSQAAEQPFAWLVVDKVLPKEYV